MSKRIKVPVEDYGNIHIGTSTGSLFVTLTVPKDADVYGTKRPGVMLNRAEVRNLIDTLEDVLATTEDLL